MSNVNWKKIVDKLREGVSLEDALKDIPPALDMKKKSKHVSPKQIEAVKRRYYGE